MKRFLVIVLVLVGLAAASWFAVRDRLAESLCQRAIARLTVAAARRGIALEPVHFRQATLRGLRAVTCRSVTAAAHLPDDVADAGADWVAMSCDQLSVAMTRAWPARFAVTVFGANLFVLDANKDPTGQQVTRLHATGEVEIDWGQPRASLAKVENEIRRLLREGRCALPLEVEAMARIRVGRRWHDVTIRSQRAAAETVFVLEPDDVRSIARDYSLPLTDAEIELVATHPVQAPRLLRLSEQATKTAHALRRRDAKFPADAFRHVLWSYLLTREFGPEFSEQVTDAHEADPTYEQGEANRRMDLANNAVGRAYALGGVAEDELVERVQTDPRVVRSLATAAALDRR